MVAENRSFYSQADYDCQRCGAPETEEMRKRVRNYIRPYCDPCLEAMKHEGHGPGSGLMCYWSETRTKVVDGRTVEEARHHPPIPIDESPTRCTVCFPRET
jgi:hypothetical protein